MYYLLLHFALNCAQDLFVIVFALTHSGKNLPKNIITFLATLALNFCKRMAFFNSSWEASIQNFAVFSEMHLRNWLLNKNRERLIGARLSKVYGEMKVMLLTLQHETHSKYAQEKKNDLYELIL